MHLSKLSLNLRDRQVRHDLGQVYELHRTLWRAFPEGDPGRILFRTETDRLGANPLVLVQSEFAPDWAALPPGYLACRAESKPYHLTVTVDQRLRFRLRANPTRRVAVKNERLGGVMAGKRVGLKTEVEQIRWLLGKGEQGGFVIPGSWVEALDPETELPIQLPNFRLDAVPEGRVRNGKPDHDGAFLSVRFEGVLRVTDTERFLQTVSNGIGSAKAFGFGLLSVAVA